MTRADYRSDDSVQAEVRALFREIDVLERAVDKAQAGTVTATMDETFQMGASNAD